MADPEKMYTRQVCIGGGSFGKVYKGIEKETGRLVAIKVIDVENEDDDVVNILQEITILSDLKSPYLTQYYGSYLRDSSLWIVMECCSGALKLARDAPPHSDIHPMKIIFLIPKNSAPTLEGDFSTDFKDFEHKCLRANPRKRPSAIELLQHPWVRQAKRATCLTKLKERHEQWQAAHQEEDTDGNGLCNDFLRTGSEEDDSWDFGTTGPIVQQANNSDNVNWARLDWTCG
ncbi:Serine/threonine-protein kinase PAK 6 [Teratosphaeriaceae sp. CCFEE 6253]|nr:Serine/threonine-protein kinase PAK 6 [Teratosphaeriaceae sp. CCFEE 6253]